MTNDDVRRIAAEIKRELASDVRLLVDGMRRLEHKVDKIDEEVEHLQNDKMQREAADRARAVMARQAVDAAAQKAADAIAARERSRKWWLAVVAAVTAAVVAITTITSVLGQYLHSNPHP